MSVSKITLKPNTTKITLTKENTVVKVIDDSNPSITLSRVGTQGPPGIGVPSGGSEGQILQRGPNGEILWGANLQDINTDFVYEADGTSSDIDITHNKNKRVSVTYINREEEQVDVSYCMIDLNTVRVSAKNPLNGYIIIK